MRTLGGPLLLGLLAFASYSLKTNYASPAQATSSQEASSKPSSGKEPMPKAIRSPDGYHEANRSCVSDQGNSLGCAIETFFGKPGPLPPRFDLGNNKTAVRFVIATVPDPIHTDLALLFDRFVEAISQGAQEAGYTFDHAALPWPTPSELSRETKKGESQDAGLRLSKLERENTPGLMLFRNANALDDSSQKHLFIILVGETPTAGINKEQFLRAVEIIRKNSFESRPRIDIIGPTFSGSLYSLRVLEKLAKGNPTFRIRSGTAMSGTAIEAFRKDPVNQDFLSFKDTDQQLIDRFIAFIEEDGFEGFTERDVAVISEDETALGSLAESGPKPAPDQKPEKHRSLLSIYFPRGISQLRTAYQEDPVLSSGAADGNVPHSTLKLNLDSTGSDDDSVPTYAGQQTAISQEAVMMGIVTVLRVHPHHFLILRATDPKDLLFLTRFFRTHFPQDRIITMGADQLFPRDINDTIFHGVLSLTNYPLLPKQLTDFSPPRPHRVFASTECAGLFNATLAILKEAENGSKADTLPDAQYFEYTPPVFNDASGEGEKRPLEKNEEKASAQRPLAWLTVMADDGYWPLATLPETDWQSAGSGSARIRPAISAPPIRISLGPSPFNQLVIVGLLVFSAVFIYLTWLGNLKHPSMLQQQFSMLTDRTRGILLGFISLLLTLAFVLLASPLSGSNWWPPLIVIAGGLVVAVSTVLNLRARGQSRAALCLAFSSAVTACPLFWIIWSQHSINENILLYRMAWLQSGVSPTLPLLLVCAALFCWAWFNLKLRSLFDQRRPFLPRGIPLLPGDDEYNADEYTQMFTRSPFFWIIVVLAIAVIVIRDVDPLSLDGTNFDDLYRIFFIVSMVLIANSMFTAWCTWKKCRALLLHLDRTPLRWAFRRIEGFSWKPLWGMAGGDLMGAYKPLSRSLEAFAHLRASLGADQLKPRLVYIQLRGSLVESNLKQLRGAFARSTASAHAGQLRLMHDNLVLRMCALQKNLALTCSLVWLAVLQDVWRDDVRSVTAGKQVSIEPPDKFGKGDSDSSASGNQSDETRAGNGTQYAGLAEEFISLIYLNFIHRVLLRLRWLILGSTSAYVLLLFSIKLYPFEPHGRIDGLLILFFLGIASVVYAIYAQMHRDATLSHLTKTTPGELGADFWIRMIGIGAVPVLSLVATQVPSLNRFFFLWLKPVIDALHGS